MVFVHEFHVDIAEATTAITFTVMAIGLSVGYPDFSYMPFTRNMPKLTYIEHLCCANISIYRQEIYCHWLNVVVPGLQHLVYLRTKHE